MPIDTALLTRLASRLQALVGHDPTLVPLADTGLAHWHVRIEGTGWLARIPKQSQMGLAAQANLAYEAACFERAAACGHVPRLHHVLAPEAALPWGALLVDQVDGHAAHAPAHMGAIVQALVALHRLPVPPCANCPPLLYEAPMLGAMLQQIRAQASHLEHPGVPRASQRLIARALKTIANDAFIGRCQSLPRRLIAFDAHPGNFLITPSGHAVLVDLEKMRYSLPPLDLAHATLYTSTSWDMHAAFTLDNTSVARLYHAWRSGMGALADPYADTLVPLRGLMWLWSVTWCAMWLAQSGQARQSEAVGQDWSVEHSDARLVAHVRQRVDHYLSPDCVQRMLDELAALPTLLN